MVPCPSWCTRRHGEDDNEPDVHETDLTPTHDTPLGVTFHRGPEGECVLFFFDGEPVQSASPWALLCVRDDMTHALARLEQIRATEGAPCAL